MVQELHADKDSSMNENALLSSGEMVLMQISLAKSLNLKRGEESEINLVTFGSEKTQTQKTAETTIGILLKGGSIMNINASVMPSITGSI